MEQFGLPTATMAEAVENPWDWEADFPQLDVCSVCVR